MRHPAVLLAALLVAGATGAATAAAQPAAGTRVTKDPAPARAGAAKKAATSGATTAAITPEDLRTRLFAYAADSMEGRATASAGHVKATDYIARELARLGLRPAGDSGTYFQRVPVVQRMLDTTASFGVDGATFDRATDYAMRDQGPTTRSMDGASVIYGGNIADMASLVSPADAAGKVVVLRLDGPGATVNRVAFSARYPGAAGIAVASLDRLAPAMAAALRAPAMQFNPRADGAPQPAFLYVTRAAAERLLGASLDSVKPGAAGRTVRGNASFVTAPTTYPVRNVVAILPGSDPALRGQYVALGAHSDHVGMSQRALDHDSVHVGNLLFRREGADQGPTPLTDAQLATLRAALDSAHRTHPARRDSIYNGADDDGSGSMGLLEVAEALSQGTEKPRRSVLFVWHTSEEMGLWGSEWFTDHPTVPRDSIVSNVNIDMIGRGARTDVENGGDDFLQLLGSRRLSTEYGDLVERVNARAQHHFRLDYSYDAPGHPQQYYCRSDHWNYGRYGIPTVFFSTGGHADYHMVSDEPQYIDYPHYARVVRFVKDVTLAAAALDHRPTIDKPVPGATAQCVQ